jgi:hypothetical protein
MACPVLAALDFLCPRRHRQKALVRKTIDYFTINAVRRDDPAYRAQGFPIASGIVASVCRLVSALRIKQPGMRWRPDRRPVRPLLTPSISPRAASATPSASANPSAGAPPSRPSRVDMDP